MISMIMSSGVYEADAYGRDCFRPNVPVVPRLEDVADLLTRTIEAVAAFDTAVSALPRPGLIGRLFARLDAVHSSAVEGSTTTFTDLLEYESARKTAPDPDDAAMVSASAEASESIVASGETDPVRIALAIHQRLFEHNRDPLVAQGAGRFKRRVNGTRDDDAAGGFFYFTAPRAVPDTMTAWGELTAHVDRKVPELVRAGLSHWMFEHIHPFDDGNGRVGRLIVPLMLKQKGTTRTACVHFGEAVHEDKDLYIEALKSARQSGDLTNWVGLFLAFVEMTAKANMERLRRLRAVEDRWKREVASFRSDAMVHSLASWMATCPAFTISDAVREIGGTFASVNMAAAHLVELGLLVVARQSRRQRLFQAPDILEIFDRFRTDAPARAPP